MARLKNVTLVAPHTVIRAATASHSATSPRVSSGIAPWRWQRKVSWRVYSAPANAASGLPRDTV